MESWGFGCRIARFWLWNLEVLVVESWEFGCGILRFWLWNRGSVVVESWECSCGSAPALGWGIAWFAFGIAWFWFWNRENVVVESRFVLCMCVNDYICIYIYIYTYIYAYVIIHIYIYIQWFFMQQKSNELENWTLWYVFTIDNHLNIWIRDCNPKISLRTENHDPCSSINPKLMVVHSYWKFSWSPQLARWGIFLMFRQQTTPETAGFVFPLWARPKFQTWKTWHLSSSMGMCILGPGSRQISGIEWFGVGFCISHFVADKQWRKSCSQPLMIHQMWLLNFQTGLDSQEWAGGTQTIITTDWQTLILFCLSMQYDQLRC